NTATSGLGTLAVTPGLYCNTGTGWIKMNSGICSKVVYFDQRVTIATRTTTGTTTDLNFDLNTLAGVTVPFWATHAIVMGVASGNTSTTGTLPGIPSGQVRISHDGTNLQQLTY